MFPEVLAKLVNALKLLLFQGGDHMIGPPVARELELTEPAWQSPSKFASHVPHLLECVVVIAVTLP